METSYPVWLEIDLSRVEQNVRATRRICGTDLMAVVKANAYGYGNLEVARAAVRGGAAWLGVARVDEGLALRSAGFDLPILVLGMIPLAQVDQAIGAELTLPVTSFESAQIFSQRAEALVKQLCVHLKVDTGLGRLGVFAHEAPALAQAVVQQRGLRLEGIFSHLANADRIQEGSVDLQIRRFQEAVDGLRQHGFHLRWVHLANTAAALSYPAACHNLVRTGQALVGHNAFSDRPLHPDIQPVMLAWKARLVSCRELAAGSLVGEGGGYVTTRAEIIGVVSAGFGDGFWRLPGNEIIVGGKRHSVIGLPDMDSMIVHLDRAYPLGSEVVLVGSQGDETITIQDLAKRYHTGPGKITAVIPARVARVYIQ